MHMSDMKQEFVSEFDEMTTTDRIRMLKSALPYVEISMQKYMAIYIKLLELMYIISYFRNEPQKFAARFSKCKSNDPREVMKGLKKYCSKSEQASVDQILQMMQAFEMYQKYSAFLQPFASMGNDSENADGASAAGSASASGKDPLSSLMGMLSPEQLKMFEMFKEM